MNLLTIKFRILLLFFLNLPLVTYAEEVLFSDEVGAMFEMGLPIPVYLNVGGETQSVQIGYADVVGKNGEYSIDKFEIDLSNQPFELKEDKKSQLKEISSIKISSGENQEIIEGVFLEFDAASLKIDISLKQSAFKVVNESNKQGLGSSSSDELSGVLDYSLNTYYTDGESNSSDLNGSMYFDSYTSFKENHLIVNGTANWGDNSGFDVDALLYERDYDGHRFAVGLLSGEYLQTSANVSTFDSDIIYAVSFGNETNTHLKDKSRSLIPIDLYFPTAGEARVFRNDDLISIQQFSIGSHQLDTSEFPSGIYQVTVEIVTNGQVSSSRQYRINKPSNADFDGLKWQVWGGYLEIDNSYFSFDGDEEEDDGRFVGGLSLSSNLRDILWSNSLYMNGDVLVQEGQLSIPLLATLSLDINELIATDDSRNIETTINYDLPYDLGQVWGSYRTGYYGTSENLDNYDFEESYSYGGSIPLTGLISWAGTFNFSYDESTDLEDSSIFNTTQVSYQQELFNTRWGSSQLTLGYNETDSSVGSDSEDYYVNVNFTIPLDANISVGYSHHDYGNTLDLSVDKTFDQDDFIQTVGLNTSTDFDENTSYSAYANYSARYIQGTMTVQSGDDGLGSVSLTAQGGTGWDTGNIAFGNEGGESGVIVKMPDNITNNDIELVVDEAAYPLSRGNNYISIDGYTNYSAFIRTKAGAKRSYKIKDIHKKYTIYPGNVITITPDVHAIVTAFSQLIDEQGNPITGATVSYKDSESNVDNDGFFSLDIDLVSFDGMVDVLINDETHQVELTLPEEYESTIMLDPVVLKNK